MKVTEEIIAPTMIADFVSSSIEGAQIVGVKVDSSAVEKAEALNRFIENESKALHPRCFSANVDAWTDLAIPLGCLLGCVIVSQFGWQWIGIVTSKRKAIAVVNENRSLVVYPLDYCFHCLESRHPSKVLLAIDLLRSDKLLQMPGACYQNLMDHIHRIVPFS